MPPKLFVTSQTARKGVFWGGVIARGNAWVAPFYRGAGVALSMETTRRPV
jgi:hypothetical protein